jgi:predicted ABC-type ATPase
VFSHPSKLDLIRDAHNANDIVVLHVLLVPEDLAVQRVKYRARAGGHDVPEIKIWERHRRLWTLVAEAIAQSDSATVYDNTRIDGPRIVAQMSGGDIIGSASCPEWTPEALRSRWPD